MQVTEVSRFIDWGTPNPPHACQTLRWSCAGGTLSHCGLRQILRELPVAFPCLGHGIESLSNHAFFRPSYTRIHVSYRAVSSCAALRSISCKGLPAMCSLAILRHPARIHLVIVTSLDLPHAFHILAAKTVLARYTPAISITWKTALLPATNLPASNRART